MQTQSKHGRLVTATQMRDVEAKAMASGLDGWTMMQRAGAAVADIILHTYDPCPVRVLCGPGNNGGDGYIIAALLRQAGWPVEVAALVAKEVLHGDAAKAASLWTGPVVALSDVTLPPEALVVDALFGTGLTRPLDGEAERVMRRVAELNLRLVAVDLLSGVMADSGACSDGWPRADITVTFGAKKPAHLLLPGVEKSGHVIVADIGVDAEIDALPVEAVMHENLAQLWRHHLRWPTPADHKYSRGAVVVLGGPIAQTGASRLAAMAALRAGAGSVTVACTRETLPVFAAHLTSVITKVADDVDSFSQMMLDKKHGAAILGPGAGVTEQTRACVLAALATGKPVVLDADALTVFEDDADALFSAIKGSVIMTPHDGEMKRLFGEASADKSIPKWQRVQEAARRSGAVIVLKGYDTVIAHPDGRTAISSHSTPYLATAGSGDVLAGIIGAQLVQGIPVFVAACAGVWMHAEAGRLAGIGLIAEDLPQLLPRVLAGLRGDAR